MNDRYRNVCKAHDHIVKGRSKEVRKVFIPHWGKENKAFNQWARSYYETTMQGVPI